MSATETQLEAVRAAVEPAVLALGLAVYDVELLGGDGARTLRLTVTREGGVDLEAITAVTQAVSPLVDKADAVNGRYLLEVSSPGIERSLRRTEHFRGAVGEQVSIKYHTEAGPCRVRGTLVAFDGEHCAVEEDDQRVEVPVRDITQARTVFEWGPQPRPGKGAKTGEAGKPRARAKEHR